MQQTRTQGVDNNLSTRHMSWCAAFLTVSTRMFLRPYCAGTLLDQGIPTLIRRTMVNKTYGTNEILYLSLFLTTVFGPIYCSILP